MSELEARCHHGTRLVAICSMCQREAEKCVARGDILRERSSAERKGEPIHSGVMLYFPDALAAVSRISVAGNAKHNPGEPLHWARVKSTDQMNASARHMLTLENIDPETGEQEAAANAWRALAQLQLLEEKRLVKAGIKPYSGITS